MPIRPGMKARYPKDWDEISNGILGQVVALAVALGSAREVAAGADKWRLAGLPLVRHPVTGAEQIEEREQPARDP